MRKKAFTVAVIVIYICLCICFSSTLAYFTDETKTDNVITTGNIKIEIIEKTIDANGAILDFPQNGMTNIMPSDTVSKIVSVANTGTGDAWIRVQVVPTIIGADKSELPTALGDGTEIMTYEIEKDWIKGEDGYYYYAKPVAPGDKTEVLFNEVAFASNMTNEYQSCTANLTITAQAVQSANNPIPKGGSVVDIVGWVISE